MLLNILIVIVVIIVIYFVLNSDLLDKFLTKTENFVPYKRNPYGYWRTGADPLNYYQMNAYRKPYRYPYTYHTSFPYPYETNYPLFL
jgi:hypothetical protein